MTALLARLEALVDQAAVANGIEGRLAVGARPRQLSVRTLLLGILLAISDGRPAHLVRVHRGLVALGPEDRRRLGVEVVWRGRPHLLTYRQVEYLFSLVVRALAKDEPDGAPSFALAAFSDALLEASVPTELQGPSSLAVDWSDHEAFARPPANGATGADPEAAWGHRRGGPGKDELFFGYYLQAATTVADEGRAPRPELVRRIALTSCALDPPPQFLPVLVRLVASGVRLTDVLCDSGYAHRIASHWALPVRRLGGQLVMDLHPHDRGMQGTFGGAICHNGNLYCPATPRRLLELGPLARSASLADEVAHDRRAAELARYKLGRITSDDEDGFHRVMCPAAMGKLRCPNREASMALGFDHPEVQQPPEPRPRCCVQQTLTVPPEVNAKTAQKHDYPSRAHRLSFARRTSVERSYSTLKDPASTDTTRGWCRVMGLCAITVLLACGVVVRNLRILDAFDVGQQRTSRRTRARRRRTLQDLADLAQA